MIDIVYQSESVYSGFISLVKVKKKLGSPPSNVHYKSRT